jgi:hypothetical protein
MIEISGFVNGIDRIAEEKLFNISDYIRKRKRDGFKSTQQHYHGKRSG